MPNQPRSSTSSRPLSLATAAVQVDGLVKTYGRGAAAVRALDDLTFTVDRGTIFGLLGPNGAGKSTTVKILTTLSHATDGTATIAGIDVAHDPAKVRRLIGYVPQRPCFDPIGTGRENLVLQARLYGLPATDARSRAAELLDRFRLADAADRRAGTWSGGMQRKLDVAMGLIHSPEILFLDEPTTGLDPEARSEMWDEIARMRRDDGRTVLLTTHYLDEADRLADVVGIVDHGRMVVVGAPDALKSELAGDAIHIDLDPAANRSEAVRVVRTVPGVHDAVLHDTTLSTQAANGAAVLPAVLAALKTANVVATAVTVARPSLDDVYLRHTGRTFRAAGTTSADPMTMAVAS